MLIYRKQVCKEGGNAGMHRRLREANHFEIRDLRDTVGAG